MLVHEKTVQNRALELAMERRWIQAVFTYVGSGRGSLPGRLPPPRARNPRSPAAEASGSDPGRGDAARTMRSPAGPPIARSDPAWQAAGITCSSASPMDSSGAHGAAGAPPAGDSGARGPVLVPGNGAEQQEWEGSAEDGVLGSDLGSMFQEPIEMVQEVVELRPGLCVKARRTSSPLKMGILRPLGFRTRVPGAHRDGAGGGGASPRPLCEGAQDLIPSESPASPAPRTGV
jgi:hypothetical protein